MNDLLTCICALPVLNPECPLHGAVSGKNLPRYSMGRALRRLDQARDEYVARHHAGQADPALEPLLLAVFHVIDYIRAKERGDI